MFCPNCSAEYRPGFIRCSDCSTELIEAKPSDRQNPNSRENEWPGAAGSYFLVWFVPTVCFLTLLSAVWVRPALLKNSFVAVALALLTMMENWGGYWMPYQALRYEKTWQDSSALPSYHLCLSGTRSFVFLAEEIFK